MVEDGASPPTPTAAPALPGALRLVGWLTILYGIGSLINIVGLALHGRYFLDISALQLFAGIGILRLRRGWRTYHLVCLWLGLALLALGAITTLAGTPLLSYGWLGISLKGVPREVLLVVSAGLAIASIWEIRVLTRPDVRKRFGLTAS